ncbi:MAG: hypothetical protein Q9166_004314 [cf. Caloplaca sp. 2 TL-2023]
MADSVSPNKRKTSLLQRYRQPYVIKVTSHLNQPSQNAHLQDPLINLRFLLHLSSAWYVDFYFAHCDQGAKAGTGIMTLCGKLDEEKECGGGPLHDPTDLGGETEASPLDFSTSIAIKDLKDSGLVVDLYAAQGCPPKSWLTQITEHGCFSSPSGDPVKFARVHKPEPDYEEGSALDPNKPDRYMEALAQLACYVICIAGEVKRKIVGSTQ